MDTVDLSHSGGKRSRLWEELCAEVGDAAVEVCECLDAVDEVDQRIERLLREHEVCCQRLLRQGMDAAR